MDQGYFDHLPTALGRLMGNLWSLEWMLRNVLYLVATPPHSTMPNPRPLFAANTGDRFPLNALTSYDSLGQLIDAYNKITDKQIDRSLITLRDTLAHGRVLCQDESWVNLVLMKFGRPDGSNTVTIETRYDLTLDWMDEQIERTAEALKLVTARYRDLGGS